MAAPTFKFTGKYGIVGAIAAILLIGYRLATLDAIEDPALQELVSAELAPATNAEAQVNIHSIKASSPLLSFSSSPRLVLKVEYEILSDGIAIEQGVRYFGARHQRHTRTWRLRPSTTTALSYYMNFL